MNNIIYPCLWFNGNAREVAEFYCSVFDNTAISSDNNMVVMVESAGQKFMCLNGGPEYSINPSISFYVACETEAETDRLWKVLLEGGSVMMPIDKYDWSTRYGWLQDRFGVNWQLAFGSIAEIGQKFTPVLMFTGKQNGRAEEAIHLYTSIFQDSAINGIMRYSKGVNEVEGAVQHAQFTLGKQLFMAMDSSLEHQFSFNEAVSFVVECKSQEEIDYYWEKFTEGGEEVQCGWLKDKFGVSWQIVPEILSELMSDPSRSERVINAFLKMKKFEIDKLLNA
jgi:predicted 3-demethylubiquinone-9 3-methyltransferase (glyoxalase superfamily)